MQKKRRLILHAGLHKTGTSYIQKSIAENRDLLQQAGVRPARLFNAEEGQHHKLVRLLVDGREDDFLEALDSSAETVLVTSEGFTHWFKRTDPRKLRAFAARLRALFDVRIVLFIRRQDFLKESVFSEIALHWYRGTIEDEQHYHYNFNLLCLPVTNAFGLSNVGLGVYRDDRPIDLLGEFLRIADIGLDPARLAPVQPQRVSPGRRKVRLLATMDKTDRKVFNPIRDAIIASPAIRDDGIKYQMSPEERRAFLGKYHVSNERLIARFGLNADAADYLLSDALHPAPWTPMEPFDAEEQAAIRHITQTAGPR
jgi:hypothetical protein